MISRIERYRGGASSVVGFSKFFQLYSEITSGFLQRLFQTCSERGQEPAGLTLVQSESWLSRSKGESGSRLRKPYSKSMARGNGSRKAAGGRLNGRPS